MNRHLGLVATLAFTLGLLILSACDAVGGTPVTSSNGFLETNSLVPCEECALATLAAAQTQDKNNANNQAAATAEILRANAQATLNSANATLSVAQTQDQNAANVVAAQIAATAEIVRANAQATLNSAAATQGAAQTQDVFRQTQVQYDQQVTQAVGTQNAIATVTQQNNNLLAGSTQTAVANTIATQTQIAVATSQWYTDQARQRTEQRQGPLTFLWLWGPPFFILSIALVCLWFFWRWMRIRETQQLIEMQPATEIVIIPEPRPISAVVEGQSQLAKPRDSVRMWLEEVKRKLLTGQKDEDDNSGS